MSQEQDQVALLQKSVAELGNNLTKGYATKEDNEKLSKQIATLQKQVERKSLKETPSPIFGDEYNKKIFTGLLAKQLLSKSEIEGRMSQSKEAKEAYHFWKQAAASLNEEDTGYGGPPSYPMQDPGFVPNLIDPVVYKLVQSYGIARKFATFRTNVKGTLNLKGRNLRAPVAYTTSGSPSVSRADVAESISGSSYYNNQLRPVQIAGIATIEEKLMYESPIDVVNETSEDLAESLALLEDQTVFLGDGTATYGNVTGIKNNSIYSSPTLTHGSFNGLTTAFTDALFQMIPLVNPAVLSLADTAFYMHPYTFSVLQTSKASTSGLYVFDLRTNTFTLGGWPIRFVNAMDACGVSSTSGQMPVVFGSLTKACVAGTGRDIGIRILLERFADDNEIGVRLVEDFGAGFPQYGASTGGQAISRIVLT